MSSSKWIGLNNNKNTMKHPKTRYPKGFWGREAYSTKGLYLEFTCNNVLLSKQVFFKEFHHFKKDLSRLFRKNGKIKFHIFMYTKSRSIEFKSYT